MVFCLNSKNCITFSHCKFFVPKNYGLAWRSSKLKLEYKGEQVQYLSNSLFLDAQLLNLRTQQGERQCAVAARPPAFARVPSQSCGARTESVKC